jgi:predicted transposase/invertase (TIGR01784 family)
MDKLKNISQKEYEYKQYTDYVFKRTVERRANGVLKFLQIPYEIDNIFVSEITNIGPKIHRLDFVGEVKKNGENICIIMECQTKLPTEDDVLRFFQYMSSIRVLKNKKVELYILCTKKAPYKRKEFVIDDECTYIMHMISLKDIGAEEIFKNIENKIEHNQDIGEEEIAALQLIAYTEYKESTLDVLERAYHLIMRMKLSDKDKLAVIWILNVLSANMLNEKDKKEYLEETTMMLNPRDEFMKNKGIEEGKEEGMKEGKEEIAKSLKGTLPIEEIAKHTGLTIEKIKSL